MKKLYRSRKTGIIAGVCSGLAEYFDMDPVLIRILFVVAIFITGLGLVAYFIAWIIMPEKESERISSEGGPAMNRGEISKKSRLGAFLFCFLLGFVGAHRFYVGKPGTAILMILTIGGVGIWWTVDCILILIGSFTDREDKFVYDWMPEPGQQA